MLNYRFRRELRGAGNMLAYVLSRLAARIIITLITLPILFYLLLQVLDPRDTAHIY
jgi:hypothetical protein